MFTSILLALHILAVAVWVGGMFFAYIALRPAAAEVLEPPMRLTLWAATFKRFFPWVWLSVLLLFVSGLGMMMGIPKVPAYILIMALLATIMIIIFAHVYFAPYARLKHAVKNQDWPTGGKYLNQIRILIGTNLALGLVTIIVATAGRSFL